MLANLTLAESGKTKPEADFTPVRDSALPPLTPAEALLEAPFRPSREDLLSFLVNGLYLIGRHRVLEWEGGSGTAGGDLEALGHAVSRGGPGLPPPPAGAYDRAFLARRAFGHAGDEADRLWLRAMRRALRPGGLLLFHAFDRDRAFGLAESLSAASGRTQGGEAGGADGYAGGAAFAFDPRTGRLTAKLRPSVETAFGAGIPPAGAPAGAAATRGLPCLRASVRAFNLGELRTLLEESGFELERAYGDWQGGALESAGARTGRLLVVASRKRRTRRRADSRTGAAIRESDREGGWT